MACSSAKADVINYSLQAYNKCGQSHGFDNAGHRGCILNSSEITDQEVFQCGLLAEMLMESKNKAEYETVVWSSAFILRSDGRASEYRGDDMFKSDILKSASLKKGVFSDPELEKAFSVCRERLVELDESIAQGMAK